MLNYFFAYVFFPVFYLTGVETIFVLHIGMQNPMSVLLTTSQKVASCWNRATLLSVLLSFLKSKCDTVLLTTDRKVANFLNKATLLSVPSNFLDVNVKLLQLWHVD